MPVERINDFVKLMLERGHNIEVIKNSYLLNLSTDSDYEEIIKYIENNPNVTKSEVNFEIHRIHLKHRGIQL